MRGARRFFSREKQVFLVGFSLTFPRFPRISKNRLNTSLGFVKYSKDFQVICCNCYRSFENAEKILNLREKKKQLAKGRALAQEKYELKRTKENIA